MAISTNVIAIHVPIHLRLFSLTSHPSCFLIELFEQADARGTDVSSNGNLSLLTCGLRLALDGGAEEAIKVHLSLYINITLLSPLFVLYCASY